MGFWGSVVLTDRSDLRELLDQQTDHRAFSWDLSSGLRCRLVAVEDAAVADAVTAAQRRAGVTLVAHVRDSDAADIRASGRAGVWSLRLAAPAARKLRSPAGQRTVSTLLPKIHAWQEQAGVAPVPQDLLLATCALPQVLAERWMLNLLTALGVGPSAEREALPDVLVMLPGADLVSAHPRGDRWEEEQADPDDAVVTWSSRDGLGLCSGQTGRVLEVFGFGIPAVLAVEKAVRARRVRSIPSRERRLPTHSRADMIIWGLGAAESGTPVDPVAVNPDFAWSTFRLEARQLVPAGASLSLALATSTSGPVHLVMQGAFTAPEAVTALRAVSDLLAERLLGPGDQSRWHGAAPTVGGLPSPPQDALWFGPPLARRTGGPA